MSMERAVAELRRLRIRGNYACAFWRGYHKAVDNGAGSQSECPYRGHNASSKGYRRAWMAGFKAGLKADRQACEGCGSTDYERDLENCPFCDRTKCSFCDPGNDVPCGLCEEEATS